MASGTRLRKEMEWRERLARFARAGTSIVEFCLDEGVSTPSFYSWRKRLSADGMSADGNTWVRSADASHSRGVRQGPFAAVRVTGQGHGGSLTASLRGGTRLDIPLADADAVRLVIEALVRVDAEQAGGRAC